MCSVPQVFMYHCGIKCKVDQFKKDNSKMLISNEDGIWLGSGMYLDNQSNLEYWKNVKTKKIHKLNTQL